MDPLKKIGMHAGASPAIFRKADMLRNNMTKEESLLWHFLKKKPYGCKFRRQHPFGIYVLDFYCHGKRLSIEIDGYNHRHPNQIQYDQERTEFIKSFNIIELRFLNEDINTRLENVQMAILEQLRAVSH